jgi:hypothetical protein
VRHLWIFAHLLGFVMWLGGALGAMALGIALRRVQRSELAGGARLLATLYRQLVLPGSVLTVVSGLVLTLMMFGGPALTAMSHPLMAMQGLGLLASLITLIALVPNAGRLTRIDPISQAQQFDALRARQARLGMVSGLLALLALIAGALGRP